MLKKILCASILAATTFTAHAAPQTWNFVYTGFNLVEVQDYNGDSQSTTTWRPDLTTIGSFTGEDLNHNNLIEKNELTELIVNNQQYVGCTGAWGPYSCYFDSFSYTTTGHLNFRVQDSWESSGNYGGGHFILAGLADRTFNWDGAAASSTSSKVWTAQTTFSITPTPTPAVPEPESYAMMGMGLLALAALQRRRAAK